MKEYLNNYIKEVEDSLKGKVTKDDLKELNRKIKFFQHERLIHLIVTMSCGVFALLFAILCFHNKLFLYPTIIMIIMLIFYIFHYYFLENKVQYLYKLYDKMNSKVISK
jgi:hypothetical protein